jgi:hypothetical protein
MGPIVFVLVFLFVPLAAALFAGGFFAALGIFHLLTAVPAGAWAALSVAAGVVLGARLWLVVRTLRSHPG